MTRNTNCDSAFFVDDGDDTASIERDRRVRVLEARLLEHWSAP
ncbi:hypothetical protein [Acetobacter sp. DmW_136]|nr:hypothetical protein [Acetobacter sp. DmW_136]